MLTPMNRRFSRQASHHWRVKALANGTRREEWNEFVEEHFPSPPGIELARQTPIMV